MQGPVELRTSVASACRPVGPTMRVTASHGNAILQLDGVPAVLALRQAMVSCKCRHLATLLCPMGYVICSGSKGAVRKGLDALLGFACAGCNSRLASWLAG